jgi:hypothetical protein
MFSDESSWLIPKSEPEEITVKKEPEEITVKKEPEAITVKKEPNSWNVNRNKREYKNSSTLHLEIPSPSIILDLQNKDEWMHEMKCYFSAIGLLHHLLQDCQPPQNDPSHDTWVTYDNIARKLLLLRLGYRMNVDYNTARTACELWKMAIKEPRSEATRWRVLMNKYIHTKTDLCLSNHIIDRVVCSLQEMEELGAVFPVGLKVEMVLQQLPGFLQKMCRSICKDGYPSFLVAINQIRQLCLKLEMKPGIWIREVDALESACSSKATESPISLPAKKAKLATPKSAENAEECSDTDDEKHVDRKRMKTYDVFFAHISSSSQKNKTMKGLPTVGMKHVSRTAIYEIPDSACAYCFTLGHGKNKCPLLRIQRKCGNVIKVTCPSNKDVGKANKNASLTSQSKASKSKLEHDSQSFSKFSASEFDPLPDPGWAEHEDNPYLMPQPDENPYLITQPEENPYLMTQTVNLETNPFLYP